MDFHVWKQDIFQYLKSFSSVTTNKIQPVLQGVFIEAKDGKITISGTNLGIFQTCTIPINDADLRDNGSVVVNANKLISILAEARDKDSFHFYTSIHEEPDTTSVNMLQRTKLHITYNKTNIILNTENSEDYPNMPTLENMTTMELNASNFLFAISKIQFSIFPKRDEKNLNGILMNFKNKNITFASTDMARMSIFELPYDYPDEYEDQSIFISKEVISELQKNLKSSHLFRFSHNDKFLCFQFGEYTIIERRKETRFPNVNNLIPTNFICSFTLNRNDLISALVTMRLMNPESVFNFEDKFLVISTMLESIGSIDATAEIISSEQMDTYKVGLNAVYLSEILKVIPDEDITINFGGDKRPGLIASNNIKAKYIFMPLTL